MVGKNNDQMLRQKEANRIERYGIRRLSVGVASVAVAGWLMMANTHLAQAAELDQSENAPQAETLETDAQSDPEGQDLTSSINGHVDPADGIKNQSDLPSGTSYQFKQPVDTTSPGVKDAIIVVTYPDGSQDQVQIKVTVKESTPELTDADKYDPQGQTIVTEVGGHPDPAEGIKNLDQLPKGSKVEFKEPVDTSTPGHKKASLMVTYSDGSKDEVAITVMVIEKATDSHNMTTDNAAAVSLLPQTGEQDATVIFGAAALSILAGLGLITKKRQED
ncbi:Rib/alpha-like domain-containing protein [Facklamia hominis]